MTQPDSPRGEVKLTPLQITYLTACVERGSTRTNDGGMADTILSGLCSTAPPLVSWRVNPNSRADGYISLYEPTDAGRAALKATERSDG